MTKNTNSKQYVSGKTDRIRSGKEVFIAGVSNTKQPTIDPAYAGANR
jgi:hypothetical protein